MRCPSHVPAASAPTAACRCATPGRFMIIEQAMGVPKGRTAAQAWLSAFIEEMKASGSVAAALERHGIEGAAVASARAR